MIQNSIVVLDRPETCVSFQNIKKLIEFFPYGDWHRIAIQLLILTGMRPSELDSLTPNNFWKDTVVWQPGKRQKKHRSVKLPRWFMQELDFYFKSNTLLGNKLLPYSYHVLRRYVNKNVRPSLGGDFLLKRPRNKRIEGEYIIQLRGLRKTFASHKFFNYMMEWGSQMAVEMTGDDMAHSTFKMTARHYSHNVRHLADSLRHHKGKSIGDILNECSQTKLTLFGFPGKLL